MKTILTVFCLVTLFLLSTSCSTASRDVASERKKCKENRSPDHESYYEDYEECQSY